MISQVTFWVEHGETTDPLVEFIDKADLRIEGASVIASDFIVDVPDLKDWEKNILNGS